MHGELWIKVAASVLVLAGPGLAQCELERLTAFDGEDSDHYAMSVDIAGNRLIVGAPQDDDTNTASGSAYVYERRATGWVLASKLNAADPFPWDLFGASVAIDGEFAVVGAPDDDDFAASGGSAYVFERRRTGWVQAAKLIASDPTDYANFGTSVDISGERVVVGAVGGQDGVYVFERTEGGAWVEQVKLEPVTFVGGPDDFGASVALDGDLVLVGDPSAEYPGVYDAGSATLFGWDGVNATELAAIEPGAPVTSGAFGRSVAVSGDTLAIASGAEVTVYREAGGTWPVEQVLSNELDDFGAALALDGDHLVVGAPGENAGAGAVYLFTRRTGVWEETALLVGSAAAPSDNMGSSVALSSVDGGGIVAGAPRTGAAGPQTAFVFSAPDPFEAFCSGDGSSTPCPCGNEGAPGHGCDNSFQTGGAELTAQGSGCVTGDTITLAVTGLPPTAPGLYFQGSETEAGGAGVPFGDGLRCVGGALLRLATKASIAGASTYPEAGDTPLATKGSLPPGGATRHYQVWYRNTAPFCTGATFNLTNGLTIEWGP